MQNNSLTPHLVRYLSLLLPIPLLAWYWSGETMHRLELQWVQQHADLASLHTLSASCANVVASPCDLFTPLTTLHALSFLALTFTLKFIFIVATLPKWSTSLQQKVLRHARWLGALGLILTLFLIIARGAISAAAVWYIPRVWWGFDTIALTTIVTFFALFRLPPHIEAVWTLFSQSHGNLVGKVVTRTEAAPLWTVIDQVCAQLKVTPPAHLVLGLDPQCQLTSGRLHLAPTNTMLQGQTLYLGMTLLTVLSEAEITALISREMTKTRGTTGPWITAAEDWLQHSARLLEQLGIKRRTTRNMLASSADPALAFWTVWHHTLLNAVSPNSARHATRMTAGLAADAHLASDTMLAAASSAWVSDVQPRLRMALAANVQTPPVYAWFADAFYRRSTVPADDITRMTCSETLQEAVLNTEREWLVTSGQVSL